MGPTIVKSLRLSSAKRVSRDSREIFFMGIVINDYHQSFVCMLFSIRVLSSSKIRCGEQTVFKTEDVLQCVK